MGTKTLDITDKWLKSIDFKLQNIYLPPTIKDLVVKDLNPILDGRGEVTELWSRPWLNDGLIEPEHVYQSSTDFGVVKGWHYHKLHTDQHVVTRGKLQLCLVDIRTDSPTFGHLNILFLGSLKPRLIKIPPMIMHGWKALSQPEVIVINFQSLVYDPKDEYKLAWDCVLENIWEPNNG